MELEEERQVSTGSKVESCVLKGGRVSPVDGRGAETCRQGKDWSGVREGQPEGRPRPQRQLSEP